MSDALRCAVVIPARDEEARIGACLRALAPQARPGDVLVVLVLDACLDATEAVAREVARETGLALELVAGPARGVGAARAAGMAYAAERLRTARVPGALPAVLATTDADTIVAPDWLARIRAAIDAGAPAVGGRITLDAHEAAGLAPPVLAAREAEAGQRLAAVRRHVPDAEHHQFSGACLALTLEAYDAVGGLPAVPALEDEALERALRAADLPIAYRSDVRVTTSARTQSHVPRGLAQVLRTASWRARTGTEAAPDGGLEGVTVVAPAGPEARGEAVQRALAAAGPVVLVLGPGVAADAAAPLLHALRADRGLLLARAAEPAPDPLGELVVRPALNLHAPELAALTTPLTRTWAVRRTVLETLPLPHGDAIDLTVLVDVWARGGLAAIAERPVAAPPPAPTADPGVAAYELLAALATRFAEAPARSSAFLDAGGTRRACLDEHPPARRPA